MSGKITGILRFVWLAVVACLVMALPAALPTAVAAAIAEEMSAPADPWALEPALDVASVKTESIDFGVDGMPAALQSGTVLMAVDVEPGRDGALIHFHADGELALARTFLLEKPNRLVVDLPGIRGDLSSNEFVLGGQFVVGVRVGKHPDKLRVVIDGADDVEAFGEYKALPSRDGLYVIIGADPQLEMKLDARLNGSGLSLGLADNELMPEGAEEPVVVAMRLTEGDAYQGNPWDEEVGMPDDAEILARISDPYLADEDGSAIPGGEEPQVVARLAQPAVAIQAAESDVPTKAAESVSAPKDSTGDKIEPALAEPAVDIWALEISDEVSASPEPVEGENTPAPAVEVENTKEAETASKPAEAAPVQTVADSEAVLAVEKEFLARAGKTVETPIAALGVEAVAVAKPEPIQVAQVWPADSAPAATMPPSPDPWSSGAGSAAPEAAVPSYAPTEIFGLQFDRDEVRDRIAILGDKSASYRLYEPDEETLIIILDNAILSEGMGERITPEFGGPTAQVTIFQQPDIATDEVRVVLRRAPGLVPDVYQRGSLILADFPNTAVAPSLPVVLIPEEPGQGGAEEEASSAAVEVEEAAIEVTEAPAESPRKVFQIDEELIGGEGVISKGTGLLASDAPMGEREFTGSPLSLDFKDVPIMDVLRLIAEVSELNIIAGDEVKGAITLRLVEVPWDQALDIVLVTRGLGYVQVGNVLRIAPSEMLQAEEAERLQERRNKEQLEDLQVKLQPVNYAAVEDVRGLVTRLLSPRGTVNTDQRTNTVIIKDIPSVINEATALIEALDTQTPQVMIEAKIVEATLDFGRELGSNWSIGTNPDSGQIRTGGVTWEGANSVAVGTPISSIPTAAMNMGFLVLDDNIRIDVEVQAMEEAGEGKVISSPRVVTLDNREAVIEQGVSIPFQTFEGGDAKLEFVDAVLSLKVTPHITPDESIIMALEVSKNAPDTALVTSTGSPAITKNQAKTETLVKNGQTLVIGGIYTIEKTTTESRVPYLHQIPLVGAAFRTRKVFDSRKELLIFVTPRIVVNPALADN